MLPPPLPHCCHQVTCLSGQVTGSRVLLGGDFFTTGTGVAGTAVNQVFAALGDTHFPSWQL